MDIFLMILFLIVCLLLIIVVLLQKGRGVGAGVRRRRLQQPAGDPLVPGRVFRGPSVRRSARMASHLPGFRGRLIYCPHAGTMAPGTTEV